MAGGVAVISSFGPQDAYLTVNPEITLFKELYNRHTPFGREMFELQMNGSSSFGQTTFVEVQRTGDLVGEMFLKVKTPVLTGTATQAWVKELMHFITKYHEIEISGHRIDKIYGFMYSAMVALTQAPGKKEGYAEMIGDTPEMTLEQASIASQTLYLPLRFWFNMRPGSFLPIIAINRHKIHIHFEFEQFDNLYKTSTGSVVTPAELKNVCLLVNYIFLDTAERRQFARVPHEYLIETHQYTGVANTGLSTTLTNRLDGFHHPVSEIVTVMRLKAQEQAKNWYSFARPDGSHILQSMKFMLNGNEYEREQQANYNSNVVPFMRHTNIPVGHKKVYIHDIALAPENFQPSSTLNFSRASQTSMEYTFRFSEDTNVYTFGKNKNVLRVISGMAGPAYQN